MVSVRLIPQHRSTLLSYDFWPHRKSKRTLPIVILLGVYVQSSQKNPAIQWMSIESWARHPHEQCSYSYGLPSADAWFPFRSPRTPILNDRANNQTSPEGRREMHSPRTQQTWTCRGRSVAVAFGRPSISTCGCCCLAVRFWCCHVVK